MNASEEATSPAQTWSRNRPSQSLFSISTISTVSHNRLRVWSNIDTLSLCHVNIIESTSEAGWAFNFMGFAKNASCQSSREAVHKSARRPRRGESSKYIFPSWRLNNPTATTGVDRPRVRFPMHRSFSFKHLISTVESDTTCLNEK